MKRDIETRADIERLLTEFYEIVIFDTQIGHHFDDLDLESHLPIIANFWEKILFGNPIYFNNPMVVHLKLHEKFPLKPDHFARWIKIFCETVDDLFRGDTADIAKSKAKTIGHSLNQRLNSGIQIQGLQ